MKAAFVQFAKYVVSLTAVCFLSACTSSGDQQIGNLLGQVTAEVIAPSIGGQAGTLVKKLAPHAGTIGAAFDGSERGRAQQASEYEAQILRSRRNVDYEMEQYLNDIVAELVRHAPSTSYSYRVRLISSNSVNAATPGGGLILVFGGLIRELENEAQVASVLAHEIGHVVKKHSHKAQALRAAASIAVTAASVFRPELVSGNNGRVVNVATNAGFSGFSRKQELEADRVGLELLAKAGYDINEAPSVFHIFSSLKGRGSGGLAALFASHPSDDQRIKQLEKLIDTEFRAEKQRGGKINDPTYTRLASKYKRRTLAAHLQ